MRKPLQAFQRLEVRSRQFHTVSELFAVFPDGLVFEINGSEDYILKTGCPNPALSVISYLGPVTPLVTNMY